MNREINSMLKKIAENRYLLDVRGYSCPYPQLFLAEALKALKKDDELEILTDNPPSIETLPRSIKNNKQTYLGTESVEPGVWKVCAKKTS